MIYPLFSKEIKEIFRNRTTLIYFFLLFSIIAYSFYSAVDLYSKASVAAVGNPLYATGFEPIQGVFVPTFGGLFIVFSLFAPFILIRPVSDEKKFNMLPLLVQLPYSISRIFAVKFIAALALIIVSVFAFIPLLFFWNYLGGHIPWNEIMLLISGYFLYGMFVVSVSFFSASVFSSGSQASVFSLGVIMFSWFVDFGKEMNVIPVLNSFSDWTTTKQLKVFESGIFSVQSVLYFAVLSLFFILLAYQFFNINIKRRSTPVLTVVLISIVLIGVSVNVRLSTDVTESRKNSFSSAESGFLKKLPGIDIEVYLEPTDGRFRDYENDFFKKLRLVKSDVAIRFAKGRSLRDNYGLFKYSVDEKTLETYSNSSEEIFMVLEELSGLKVEKQGSGTEFKGYPLVVKKKWSIYLFLLYLFIFPVMIVLFYYKRDIFSRRKKYEK